MKKALFIFILIQGFLIFPSNLINEVSSYYLDKDYIKIINTLEFKEDLSPELTYFLAESYLYSITDPVSWIKYNSKYQDTIVKCLENDPNNVLYQLNSATGMMWFPSSRGNKKDGVDIILKLEKLYPDHPYVLFTVSNYRYAEGLIKEAKRGYLKVLEISPENESAKEILESIEIDEKELEIRSIKFTGNQKIDSDKLLNKIAGFKGSTLNKDSRVDISNKLLEKAAVIGAKIKAKKVDKTFVDLEIEIFEENSKVLMFQQTSGLGLDSSNDLFPSGLMPPVIIYIDNNLLGTGSNLMFISVFVYNRLKLTIPGIIDDKFLDFKLDVTSMLLPSENSLLVNGEKIDGTKKNTYHLFKAGLGRTFPFSLSSFLYYQLQLDIHEELGHNITPNHLITHSVSSEIVFNSSGAANTPFDLQEGLLFKVIPEINYKQDYKPWGDPENLTTHDDNVSLTFLTQMGYYKNLNSRNNLSALATWFINNNPYDTDRFSVGHKGDAVTNYSLSGYLPGEVIFDNGILMNIKHTFTPKANKFNIYGKYDVAYDIKNSEFYNGVALGAAVKLNWDLNLKSEFGVGLNAVRDNGPGFFFSVELSKLMIF